MADMGEQAAEGADNPDEQQRLESARALLECNGALVFKLNGAMADPRLSLHCPLPAVSPACLQGCRSWAGTPCEH